jgi:hypothetical protein
MAKKRIEYANFVCRFGERFVLVDQLQDVIIPAFFNEFERKTAKTRLFLHDVSMIEDSKDRHVIAGRLVKDTILEREKLYDAKTKTLKDSAESLRSSPTSFFVLILETHRLMFIPEHRGSPTLKTFETVMQRFLLDAYIERYGEKSGKLSPTNKSVERLASPELQIVRMMSAGSLESFLDRFELIQQLSIRVAEVNNEFDNSELIEDLRKSHRKMQSKQTDLKYKNTSDGLSREEVSTELVAVGKGTGYVNVIGRDPSGRKIEGNNEQFGIRTEVEAVPDGIVAATDLALREFDSLLEAGAIDPGHSTPSIKSKVKLAYESMESQNDAKA